MIHLMILLFIALLPMYLFEVVGAILAQMAEAIQ
jgi:hypothetical protein